MGKVVVAREVLTLAVMVLKITTMQVMQLGTAVVGAVVVVKELVEAGPQGF
jgi:hypothetical protein